MSWDEQYQVLGDLEVKPIMVGPFEVEEWIGSGAMGDVWRGRHVEQGVEVAVKVISGRQAGVRRFQEAFEYEVRSAASLEHPFVLKLYDTGLVEVATEEAADGELRAGSPYLVMEYGRLGTLGDRIGEGLPWPVVKMVAVALLDGLAHCHARGLIHRDMKPQNVVLTPMREGWPGIRLTDFGLAYAMRQAQRKAGWGLRAGTPAYMAPEQVLGEYRGYGPGTDLYGMGCMLVELLTGRPPFEGTPVEIADAQVKADPPNLSVRAEVGRGIDGWFQRLLAKKSGERFRSAAEAARALEEVDGRLTREEVVRAWSRLTGEEEGGREDGRLRYSLQGVRRGGDWAWRSPGWRPQPVKMVNTGEGLCQLRDGDVVGREEERARLWSRFEEIRGAGSPQVGATVIRGGAGVGKDRLARWLVERAEALGLARVLRVQSEDSPRVGDGLEKAVERSFRLEKSSRAEVRAFFDEFWGEATNENARSASERRYMAEAMTELVRPFQPGDMGRRLKFTAAVQRRITMVNFVSELARREPLLIWLRDVQWGLEGLEFAARALREATGPVMMVITVRDDLLPANSPHQALVEEIAGGSDEIELEGMEEEEILALVTQRLFLESSTAWEVVKASSGNPQFALEVIQQWLGGGLKSTPEGFVRVKKAGGVGALGSDLMGIWERAVEQIVLTQPAWETALKMGAVLGERVDQESWQRATERVGGRWDEELLRVLLQRRYLRGRREGLVFSPRMFREALLQRVRGTDEGRRYFEVAADVLEEEGRAENLETVGFLQLESGDALRGAKSLLKAGERRCEQAVFHGASYLAEEAYHSMEKGRSMEAPSESGMLMARLANLKTKALRVLGDNQEAEVWAKRALAHAEAAAGVKEEAEARMYLTELYYLTGRLEESMEEGARVLALASEVGGLATYCAKTCVALGSVAKREGRNDEAIEWTKRGKEYARQAGDLAQEMTLEHLRLSVAITMDDVEVSIEEFEVLVERSQESGSRVVLGRALNVRAEIARKRREWEVAEQYYQKAIEVYRSIEPDRGMTPELNRALVSMELGKYQQGFWMMENLLYRLRRKNLLLYVMFATAFGLPGVVERGEWQEAMSRLERVFELMTKYKVEGDKDLMMTMEHVDRLARRRGGPEAEAVRAKIRERFKL